MIASMIKYGMRNVAAKKNKNNVKSPGNLQDSVIRTTVSELLGLVFRYNCYAIYKSKIVFFAATVISPQSKKTRKLQSV